jgi:D-galactarolactone cycloisomerase
LKITKIKPYILQYKLDGGQRFAYSQAWYDTRTIMILEIVTDEGLSGWGEAFGPAFVHKSIINSVYAPYLLGKDPLDNEVIWEHLYNKLRDHGQKGAVIEALSAVDIALWDIKGKALNMPVYKAMGGAFRDRLKAYATGLYYRDVEDSASSLVEEALQYAEQGFRAMKIKIGFGLSRDERLVKEIRGSLGDDIDLMVDANHAYNAKDAIALGRRIEPYRLLWFEEPVPPEDLKGYKEVKAKVGIPIAGGEAEFTRFGFQHLINERCADILQPDCCVMGGLTEYKKIMTLASLQNVQCYPHVWGSAIAVSAGIHAGFSQPDFPGSLNPAEVYLELDRTPNIFREELSLTPLTIREGYVSQPTEPGLGITINHQLIDKYRIG